MRSLTQWSRRISTWGLVVVIGVSCIDLEAQELVGAYAFGSRNLTCATESDPSTNYTMVLHESPEALQYDEARGWGYEVLFPDPADRPYGDRGGYGIFGPFDDSPNNRNEFPDTCPAQLYDSFIGAKNFLQACDELVVGDPDSPCSEVIDPDGIIFRVEVPNGFYRFVAVAGSADNRHVSRILAEDGGEGSPLDIGPDHVVLVDNHNQAEYGAGNFASVGFDGKEAPRADGPQFTNMDDEGFPTRCAPNSPVLEVTQGYIRIHQLQGNSNPGAGGDADPNGGNMVLLELWRFDERPEIRSGGSFVSLERAFPSHEQNCRAPGDEIDVELTFTDVASPTRIEETFPEGWTVTSDGGGTVNGNTITFEADTDGSVSYVVRSSGDCSAGTFEATITPADGCATQVSSSICCTQPPCEFDDSVDARLVWAFYFGSRELLCTNAQDEEYIGIVQTDPLSLAYYNLDTQEIELGPGASPEPEEREYGFEILYSDGNLIDDPDLPLPIHSARNGYEIYGPLDDSPNGRNKYPDDCPEEMYDSFIGSKDWAAGQDSCSQDINDPPDRNVPCADGNLAPIEADGIIFRVDVPNGRYRFVAAMGDTDNVHSHRLIAEDGGWGPPQDGPGENHVVLVNNFDQAQQTIGQADANELGEGVFARVGFAGRIPPLGDGQAPSPQFVDMDESGLPTTGCANSPTLEVTEGYIRFHALQGNSNDGPGGARDPNGGDLVTLEIWEVDAPSGASLMPGDVNGDGDFNITDPVAQLASLFSGGELPDCYVVPGSNPIQYTSTGLAILDFNGDGDNDITDAVGALSFLFSSGPAHVLGEDCVTLPGDCVSNCRS